MSIGSMYDVLERASSVAGPDFHKGDGLSNDDSHSVALSSVSFSRSSQRHAIHNHHSSNSSDGGGAYLAHIYPFIFMLCFACVCCAVLGGGSCDQVLRMLCLLP